MPNSISTKILPFTDVDKKLFLFSEKDKLRTVDDLIINLKLLIQHSCTANYKVRGEMEVVDKCSMVLNEDKLDCERKRLKALLVAEKEKVAKRKRLGSEENGMRKRKKVDADSLPIVLSVDELVGKRCEHFTFDFNGKKKWFVGTVVCLKPDNNFELVVRYDCEEENFYSFSFADFEMGHVRLLPLVPRKLIGKKIKVIKVF